MWLSWLGIVLQGKRSLVQFLVRACAWAVVLLLGLSTSCLGACKKISVSLSHRCFSPLSPSLPLSLKINKIYFFKKCHKCEFFPPIQIFVIQLTNSISINQLSIIFGLILVYFFRGQINTAFNTPQGSFLCLAFLPV